MAIMGLRVTDLAIKFGNVDALKPVSVSFDKGKVYAIIGPESSGKTTLLLSMAGLLPVKLPENRVFLEDKKLEYYGKKTIAKKIAFISKASRFYSSLKTRKYISLGYFPYNSFFFSYSDVDLFDRIVEGLQLQDVLDRSILALSTFELRKVMVARGLYQSTSYLLVDSIEEGLADDEREELLKAFRNLKDNRSLVVATRDVNFGYELADELVLMKAGEISGVITEKKLLTTKQLQFLYERAVEKEKVNGKVKFNLKS